MEQTLSQFKCEFIKIRFTIKSIFRNVKGVPSKPKGPIKGNFSYSFNLSNFIVSDVFEDRMTLDWEKPEVFTIINFK